MGKGDMGECHPPPVRISIIFNKFLISDQVIRFRWEIRRLPPLEVTELRRLPPPPRSDKIPPTTPPRSHGTTPTTPPRSVTKLRRLPPLNYPPRSHGTTPTTPPPLEVTELRRLPPSKSQNSADYSPLENDFEILDTLLFVVPPVTKSWVRACCTYVNFGSIVSYTYNLFPYTQYCSNPEYVRVEEWFDRIYAMVNIIALPPSLFRLNRYKWIN